MAPAHDTSFDSVACRFWKTAPDERWLVFIWLTMMPSILESITFGGQRISRVATGRQASVSLSSGRQWGWQRTTSMLWAPTVVSPMTGGRAQEQDRLNSSPETCVARDFGRGVVATAEQSGLSMLHDVRIGANSTLEDQYHLRSNASRKPASTISTSRRQCGRRSR